jgi:hypothetical protein
MRGIQRLASPTGQETLDRAVTPRDDGQDIRMTGGCSAGGGEL